jgi:hypothetical protein
MTTTMEKIDLFNFKKIFSKKMKPGRTDLFDFKKIFSKKMKPEEFVSSLKENKHNIKSSKFVSPDIGDNGFGHFVVELKDPFYTYNYEEE